MPMRDHGRHMPPPRLRFAPSPDRPDAPRLGRGRGRQRARARAALGGELAAAHRRHGRGQDGRGRRAGDPGRSRLARAGAGGAARASERAPSRAPRGSRAGCWPPPTPIAASARPRRSATTGAAARSRAAMPSGATRPARRTSCASACHRARSSSTTRRAVRCASQAMRSPTSCSCAQTAGRRSTSPAASTTATSRSRTSCAARITWPTPPGICCCCARWARSSPSSRTARSSSAPTASGSRRARAPSRSRALRARGVPPEAVVAYAAQLACPAQGGAGEVASFDELAAALLARAPRPRHRACRSRAPGLARPRGPRRGCRSGELARRLVPFLPQGTPAVVLEALAEAARGASALGDVADSATQLAQRPAGPPPDSPGARRSSASCARPTSASTCRTTMPSSSSIGCARSARPAASRPATCYTP